MNKHSVVFFSVLSLIAVLNLQTAGIVRGQDSRQFTDSEIHVIESTSQDLILELNTPPFQLSQGTSDRGLCQSIIIPGWGLSGDPGEPALPIKGTLVGVPPDADISITTLQVGREVVLDNIDLCPAATPIKPDDLTKELIDLGEELVVNPVAYNENRNYPDGLTFLDSASMIRSQKVVQVLLHPFHYNPYRRQITYFTNLRVQVQFNSSMSSMSQGNVINEGSFETILRNQLANYDTARKWRVQAAGSLKSEQFLTLIMPAYKLAINQNGLVRLTYTALQTAGLPVDTLDPRTFQIFNQGSEVAILVQGESDGKFNTTDSVIFYGQKINTRYTDTNIYWLTWGKGNGLRMSTFDGATSSATTPSTFITTVHSEVDQYYMIDNPSGTEHNRWYWDAVNLPSAGVKSFIVNLTNVGAAGTAHVRGQFKGYAANPQHHTHISINGHLISEEFWPARSDFSFNIAIPQTYLIDGANIIQVEGPLTDGITINQILIDWFEVDYNKNYAYDGIQTRFSGDNAGDWKYRLTNFPSNDAITWDITNPSLPVQIINTTFESKNSTFDLVFNQTIASKRLYIAATPANIPAPVSITLAQTADLHASSLGADYIIITHPTFINAIQPLATYYATRGLRVQVVNVMDIYDEFNGGVFNPQAIHDFLAYTYNTWVRPAPTYVLLVGDGNYDFKNYSLSNEPNYIPPYLAEVDPWMGETAADNRYVTVSGDDIQPDMVLGRLPVQTSADASAAVEKILDRYNNYSGEWSRKALFAAGTNDSTAGNFPAFSDSVVNNYINNHQIIVDKVYYGTPPFTNGSTASLAITSAINEGRGFVHFIGHSNPYMWFGDINVANANTTAMLNKTGVQDLMITGKYPIFISMTCYTGYYIQPPMAGSDLSTLDEMLIRANGKGAVATWSPTGKGVASGHDLLDAGFFTAIYEKNATTIGLATNQAKYYLYANSNGLHRELIDTYVLFGDPAMLYRNTPTSANLNYFRAKKASGGVALSWETTSEATTAGFNLYRRELSGEFIKLNTEYIPAQMGGQPQGSSYTYLDTSANPATVYEYKLDVIENSLQVSTSLLTTYLPYSVSIPFLQR